MRSIFRRAVSVLVALSAAIVWIACATAAERPARPPAPAPTPIHVWSDQPDWVTCLAFTKDAAQVYLGTYEELRVQGFSGGILAKLAVQGLQNGPVKLLANDQTPIKTLAVQPGYLKSIAVSPDGRSIAVGHYQAITLIDAADFKVVRRVGEPAGYVTGLCFSPDGQRLAASCDDESATIFQVNDGKPLHSLKHDYPVQGIAWSPDGKQIATASGDDTRITKHGAVKLWDAASGELIFSSDAPRQAATVVAFSPDGKLLAAGGFDTRVLIFDRAQKKATSVFEGHGRPTTCLAFSRDGKLVVSGSGGRAKGRNEVKVWERDTGLELATLDSHAAAVTSLALSPDERILVTAGQDKMADAWDFAALVKAAREESAKAQMQLAAKEKKPKRAPEIAQVKNEAADAKSRVIRIGIIGLDTSHAPAFAKVLNDPKAAEDVSGCRVVAAYPRGSKDIISSTSRVPDYTREFQKMGIEIVESIDDLLTKVDAVLLESNDGRPHVEQALPVMKAGKPLFIDKPIAGSLSDAIVIFEAAKRYKVPMFSSSSLRYGKATQEARAGAVGKIVEATTKSPATLEKTHPDLFWYGIHGVESLFTVMGTGCQSVKRTVSTDDEDVVVGTWEGGRKGTFEGSRKKGGYGGTVKGDGGKTLQVGQSEGYRPLLVPIVKFLRTKEPPVSEAETLEVYAFMEAADESKRQGGAEVTLESVMKKARAEAEKKLSGL